MAQEENYRLHVVKTFPDLEMLDRIRVSDEERAHAKKITPLSSLGSEGDLPASGAALARSPAALARAPKVCFGKTVPAAVAEAVAQRPRLSVREIAGQKSGAAKMVEAEVKALAAERARKEEAERREIEERLAREEAAFRSKAENLALPPPPGHVDLHAAKMEIRARHGVPIPDPAVPPQGSRAPSRAGTEPRGTGGLQSRAASSISLAPPVYYDDVLSGPPPRANSSLGSTGGGGKHESKRPPKQGVSADVFVQHFAAIKKDDASATANGKKGLDPAEILRALSTGGKKIDSTVVKRMSAI